MTISLTLNSVTKDASGHVRFRFATPSGEQEELEFQSLAGAVAFAQGTLTRDVVKAVAVALVLTRQPALGNPGLFAGKVMTVDLTAANWGTVA